MLPISSDDFDFLRRLIYTESGIHLSDAKRELVSARLSKRLKALNLPDFGEYCRRLSKHRDPREIVLLIDCISTNETHFFRENKHFDFLTEKVFPEWKEKYHRGERAREIRVWSAACSTGEEPYSLAMLLLEHFPIEDGWLIDILGTDISTRVLKRAEEGLWPIDRALEIPLPLLQRFMRQGVGASSGWMRAGPEIRSIVHFMRLNLTKSEYMVAKNFDVIFCRNVLIYFDPQTQAAVVNRLAQHLSPGGYFFSGHAESLHPLNTPLRCVHPSVYMASPPAQNTGGPS
jgi:chemotaxis protein methyltransferase CheR